MGLSYDSIEVHIESWEQNLSGTNIPHRKHWPSKTFRHEPLPNLVEILKTGQLLSRADANPPSETDIAPTNIIGQRDDAHDKVRLYFRPMNPTQYHIEGIKKPGEYYEGKHAPVLFILVFDARKILSLSNCRFSDGNMQSPESKSSSTEEFFASIPFEKVYHAGWFDNTNPENAEIVRHRCAEVLLESPLSLNDSLECVLCRSHAERATLLYHLGASAESWVDKIIIASKPGMFEQKFTYVQSVDGHSGGVNFHLHPRKDGQSVTLVVSIWDSSGAIINGAGPIQVTPGPKFILEQELPAGEYTVQIDLEGSLAYLATFTVEELPF